MFTDDELALKIELGNEGEHYDKLDRATSKTGTTFTYKNEYSNYDVRRLAAMPGQLEGPSFFKPITIRKDLYLSTLSEKRANWLNTYGPAETALADAFYKVGIIPSATDYLEDLRNKQIIRRDLKWP